MKNIIILSTMLLTLFALGSCSESEEVSEYDNWQVRNQQYVDSIAALADAGTDGWTKIVAYTLVDSVENKNPDPNHYVYVQKVSQGEGTRYPMYNDSIRVHYLGRLIPSEAYPQGRIFGKSYSTNELNEATDVPTLMALNSNIVGFATATLHMVEGDAWKIVVPYYLGYGENDYSSASIPGFSTLIFDIKLARIYRYKVDTDTSWQ